MRALPLLAVLLALALGGVVGWRVAAPPDLARWREGIEAAARESGVDAHLLRALAVVESGGNPQARSRVGAMGLLQLMPATGEEQAARLGIPWQGEATLADPATNLRLGASYLKRMLVRFDGQAPFAVAAYNAGPERVKRWRWRAADADALTAVLREGFDETRRHTARVIALRDAYAGR